MADYSDAERKGFVLAYIWFVRNILREDKKTDEELAAEARALYKGCLRHFKGGVERLCRIREFRDNDERFNELVDGLLDAETHETFSNIADQIVTEFPLAKNWMEWWKRPTNASMIFRSKREMDGELWDALPDTTNAEESMHWCLYQAVGCKLETFEGLTGLVQFADSFQRMYEDARSEHLISFLNKPRPQLCCIDGVPLDYGKPERWTELFESLGTTHPGRAAKAKANRTKNDGRPPDTRATLESPKKKKASKPTPAPSPVKNISPSKQPSPRKRGAASKNVPTPSPVKNISPSKQPSPKKRGTVLETVPAASPSEKGPFKRTRTEIIVNSNEEKTPSVDYNLCSYPYSDNSCWLDTSLEVVYRCIDRGTNDFKYITSLIDEATPLFAICKHLLDRVEGFALKAPGNSVDMFRKLLKDARNTLRLHLAAKKISGPLYTYDELWVRRKIMQAIYIYLPELQEYLSKSLSRFEDGIDFRVESYFKPMVVYISWCTGDNHNQPHRIASITATQTTNFYELNPSDYATYNGNIQSFLKNMIDPMSLLNTKSKPCWRARSTEKPCEGMRTVMKLTVSLPVVLILHINLPSVNDQQHVWNFNETITIEGDNDRGVIEKFHYDIVGRTYWDTNHFTACVSSGFSCYEYNDMVDGGILRRMDHPKGATALLAGKHVPSKGVATCGVVYHLREGLKGQKAIQRRIQRRSQEFLRISIKQASETAPPSITLVQKDEVPIDDETPYSLPTGPAVDHFDVCEYEIQGEGYMSQMDASANLTKSKASTSKDAIHELEDGAPMPDDTDIEGIEAGADVTTTTGSVAVRDSEGQTKRTKLSQRASMSASPNNQLDEENHFRCRCGFYGRMRDSELDQNIVQCDGHDLKDPDQECGRWSHYACQTDGWASDMKVNEKFLCPKCRFGFGSPSHG